MECAGHGRWLIALLAVGACSFTVNYEAGADCDGGACSPDSGSGSDGGGPGLEVELALYYSFDDYLPHSMILDRSGHGLDAFNGDIWFEGRYGRALDTRIEAAVRPMAPGLYDFDEITIGAWIWTWDRVADSLVFGQPGILPAFRVSTDMDGVVYFATNNCVSEEEVATPEPILTDPDTPTFLAVSWDGQMVRFYVNAELAASQPLDAEFCVSPDRALIEDIRIDELRVWHRTLGAEEIAKAMSQGEITWCGDGVIGPGEECEVGDLCCDGCKTLDDGKACGGSATCLDGVCQIAGGRTELGLLAAWGFDEGEGDIVADRVNSHDLSIETATYTWIESGLTLDSATTIVSEPVGAIVSAIQATEELTLEAWVAPSNLSQVGPARILSMGRDTTIHGAVLGQTAGTYVGRAATINTLPQVPGTPGDVVEDTLTHVVFTRSADGIRHLYVDGRMVGTNSLEGSMTSWDVDYTVKVGHDLSDGDVVRTWLGTLYFAAIYDRALTAGQVAAHFLSGEPAN